MRADFLAHAEVVRHHCVLLNRQDEAINDLKVLVEGKNSTITALENARGEMTATIQELEAARVGMAVTIEELERRINDISSTTGRNHRSFTQAMMLNK